MSRHFRRILITFVLLAWAAATFALNPDGNIDQAKMQAGLRPFDISQGRPERS